MLRSTLAIKAPSELRSLNGAVHDAFFDFKDVTFDANAKTLTIAFKRPITSGRYWWRTFILRSSMEPSVKGVLTIQDVESCRLVNIAKVETTSFDRVVYNNSSRIVTIKTNTPSEIVATINEFAVSVVMMIDAPA
jgi:hypothetical protein